MNLFLKNTLLMLGIFILASGAVALTEWLMDRPVTRDARAPELLLKSVPSEVLFSKAYKGTRGQNEIRYAYYKGTETVKPLDGEDAARRTPNSQTIVLNTFENDEGKKMEELQTTFISDPQFYQTPDGVWRPIEYATTTQEAFSRSGAIPHIVRREFVERMSGLFGARPVFAETSTFNPDADPESSSVDGDVNNTGADGESFASVRSAASGSSFTDSATTLSVIAQQFSIRTSNFYTIRRAFLLFDTSSLTSSATISSATLSVFVTATQDEDDDGSDTINVITTTPASNTSLSTDDYDQVGSTLQASAQDITSISTSVYLDFALNSTGLGNISKTGVTKFGLREGHDLANIPPLDGLRNSITTSTAEETGTSQDPKLVVVYTLPAAPIQQDTFWFD